MNTPVSWKVELFLSCGLPGLPRTLQLLEEGTMDQVERNEHRRTSAVQAGERIRRNNNRESAKKETPGQGDYRNASPANRSDKRQDEKDPDRQKPEILDRWAREVVGRETVLVYSEAPLETSDYLIPIEQALEEFPKLRDTLRKENSAVESSRCRSIGFILQQPPREDLFSLPGTHGPVLPPVTMSFGDDLDEWDEVHKVHMKEITIRSRDRGQMDDEDGKEDEYETSDDNPGASMPMSSQNFQMSADTASNMSVIRAKISDENQ
jgi:hypothetical protein